MDFAGAGVAQQIEREREPAPMALVVLRIEGLATAASRLGPESANVLRRKVAVRLRANLRPIGLLALGAVLLTTVVSMATMAVAAVCLS